MRRIGLNEVRAAPDKYLQEAIAGHTVVITDDGNPVAILEPFLQNGASPEEPDEADIIPPAEPGPIPAEFFQRPLIKAKTSVLASLLEERRNGR
jgi:antitoxin (DNA-binding transcriptional repressor) of toxin-antitoxin stability system